MVKRNNVSLSGKQQIQIWNKMSSWEWNNSFAGLTTARGKRAWCFGASGLLHLAKGFSAPGGRPAGTRPPRSSRRTAVKLLTCSSARRGWPVQPEWSWAGTESGWHLLFQINSSVEAAEVSFTRSCSQPGWPFHQLRVCKTFFTWLVKETNSWAKLPIVVKAVLKPLKICMWEK